ncbi:hypothetical protein BJ138DRAFT_166664 [Hygrophoropsis aurantiaca]|uniref:Uncharacterized protein n=1 Tax=Hygrophoropsis aurantiaca TaxID=72124 RepID=A0ACB8A9H9_9AGAM|nr:hypothetical protein BJ138DRAFT_166664 [Hygrophoropsis aurantiaca]
MDGTHKFQRKRIAATYYHPLNLKMPLSHQPENEPAVSALAFLLWELCTTLDTEIDFIWSKPHKSPIKWLFILTRYIAIAALVMNVSMFMNGAPPPMSCKGLIALQIMISEVMITMVEFILALRAVALYNGNSRLRIFLLGIVIVGTTMSTISFAVTVNDFEFGDPVCSITLTTRTTDFAFTFIVTEFIILLLTLAKGVHTLCTSARRIPLVEVLLRDGILSYLSCLIVAIPTTFLFAVRHDPNILVLEPHVFILIFVYIGSYKYCFTGGSLQHILAQVADWFSVSS